MLFELGVLSTDAAVRTAREMLAKPHELGAIIANVLNSLENTMRANPPELIIEAIPNPRGGGGSLYHARPRRSVRSEMSQNWLDYYCDQKLLLRFSRVR